MTESEEKLNLELPKKNVFVTQLLQREDEEDVHYHPVVTETGGKLLETGINTLQKTLLLKRETEADSVNEELARKKQEFQERMAVCAERRLQLQKKQQQMKDRVAKFEKFIKDNEAKRKRAIQKYQQEVRMKEQKKQEEAALQNEFEEMKSRHEYLKERLEVYKKFEDYLLRVLDILPPHYLKAQDSMVNSLMMRHQTLNETNQWLVNSLQENSETLKEQRQEFERQMQEHITAKLASNSHLSQLQKEEEKLLESNQLVEQYQSRHFDEKRNQRTEFGRILMAIDNLAQKCHRKLDRELHTLNYREKLRLIKDFIDDYTIITESILAQSTSTSSPAPSKADIPTVTSHTAEKVRFKSPITWSHQSKKS